MSAFSCSDAELGKLFTQVAAVLKRYQRYWQLQPMARSVLPFDAALNSLLQSLSLTELTALEDNPEQQQRLFGAFFPELFALPATKQVEPAEALPEWPFWLTNGIGGRKLSQIQHFCQQLAPSELPLLEWCAGKGHLGRLLAAQGRQVTSIEWQAELCRQGEALAAQFQLPQRFVCADVLTPAGRAVLSPQQQLVALHACGDLHLQLIKHAVAVGAQALQLAPCCYHLIAAAHYQPLSTLAQQHNLQLSRQDLKLAVQAQVTGGERVARLRQTEVSWRLAYQLLRTELTADANYQPLPSLPKHWFSGDFSVFLAYAAQLQQLPLPAVIDDHALLAKADEAYLQLQRIDAVRHLFRRPLELYLVLDRAQYLQQHGYQVQLSLLCDYTITPRNFLLQARRLSH
ncbi:MAG: class I SAM-dependent methyltransferase [Alishewanella aestuarii]